MSNSLTEYQVDASNNLLNFSQLSQMARDFLSKFTIAAGPISANPIFDPVAYSDMDSLRSTLSQGSRQDYSFIRAIRIYYGYDSGANAIKLLYVPVILDYIGTTGLADSFAISPSSLEYSTTIYQYKVGIGFQPIDLNTAIGYVYAYRNNILINRGDGSAPAFVTSDTINGDANAALITFQEIDLLNDNSTTPPTTPPVLYVTCTSEPYVRSNTYKHFVAIACVSPLTTPAPTGNNAVAADYTNLCPPNCPTAQINKNRPVGVIRNLI